MRRVLLAAALCASALVAPVASADDRTEQARVYFDAGAQAYAAGRYPVAVEAFGAAYKLVARPQLLFSLAQAERKQFWVDKKPDGLAHAILHYRAYLAEVAEGGRRDDAATAISELEPAAARLGPAAAEPDRAAPGATRLLLSSQAPNAKASIDAEAPGLLPRLVEIVPGKHHVKVSADGFYADERDVVTLGGVTTPVELNLREQPGLLTIVAEAGATVVLDGRDVGTLPLAAPIEASSGHHMVAIARNGRQLFSSEVTLERGHSKTVTAPLLVTRQRRIAETVLIVGGASVLAGAAFLGVAAAEQSSAQDIQREKQSGNISGAQLTQYNADIVARDGWRTASIAVLGGGGAVLLAGGALFLFDHPAVDMRRGAEAPPVPAIGPAGCGCSVEVSLLPVVHPGFGGVGVVGRF